MLYLKSLSRNSALVHNYSHYEQSHNELSSRRAVSVSVALNAHEQEREAATCVNVCNGCIAMARSLVAVRCLEFAVSYLITLVCRGAQS